MCPRRWGLQTVAGGARRGVGMIGRVDEVESIRAFLDSVGRGGLALAIQGEVGIGRTALVDEATRVALERGFRVRSSRPAEPDGELSFSGLADLFGTDADELVAGLPGPQRRALEVALLLRDPEGEPSSSLAVSLAVRSVLDRLADEGPVLLSIDDAQWLDAASAHVVAFALRRIGDRPVGMVAAVRSGPDALPQVFSGLPREAVRTLRPGPLAREEIGALLRTTLGLTLTGAELDRVHHACGGIRCLVGGRPPAPAERVAPARRAGPNPARPPGAGSRPARLPAARREGRVARAGLCIGRERCPRRCGRRRGGRPGSRRGHRVRDR